MSIYITKYALQLLLYASFLLPLSRPHTTIDVINTKHIFHISKSEMRYNEHANSFEISTHIFLDDLEKALMRQTAEKLNIGNKNELPAANQYIKNYIQQHFQVRINDKDIPYHLIGKEISADYAAVWCYMEIKNLPSIQKIAVKNTILTDVYADQKNLINLTLPNGKTGYLILTKYKSEEIVEIGKQ
jgi:hypothetical protein